MYDGFVKNFISADEILDLYYDKELITIDDSELVNLEITKELKEDFRQALKKISTNFCNENKIDLSQSQIKSDVVWQLTHLKKVTDANLTIDQKLNEVESLWALFNYPKTWEDFIYYLPNEKTENNNKESVYTCLTDFLKKNPV